jgi:hypothetical protein
MPEDTASGASKVVDCNMTSFCKSPASTYSMRSKSYGSDLDLLSLGATHTDVEITSDAEDSDAYLDDTTSVAESRPSVDLVDQLAGLMAGLAEHETDAEEEEDAALATKSPYLSESESEVVVPLNAEEQLSFGIATETAGARETDSQLPPAADKFAVLRVIGHGLHGHVRVVRDRQTSKLYALKVCTSAEHIAFLLCCFLRSLCAAHVWHSQDLISSPSPTPPFWVGDLKWK